MESFYCYVLTDRCVMATDLKLVSDNQKEVLRGWERAGSWKSGLPRMGYSGEGPGDKEFTEKW